MNNVPYQKSNKHIDNASNASKIALSIKIKCEGCERDIVKASYQKHFDACLHREINAKHCNQCGEQIFNYGSKFCNRSCAASFNNKGKISSEQKKEKISEKLSGIKRNSRKGITRIKTFSRISFYPCNNCKKLFCINTWGNCHNITCSIECRRTLSLARTYLNGSRKNFKYITKAGDIINLESSWEVDIATLLDEYNISWVRPKPIWWIDSKQKKRAYYPDFYLTDIDTYLDPKNPYCMKLGAEKMSVISKKVKIVFGDIQIIRDFIEKHSGRSG